MSNRPYFQYTGFTEPPVQGTVNPDVTNWRPHYPDRIPPLPGLSGAILAGAVFFLNIAGNAQVATAAAQSQVFPGKQVQYQSTARPLLFDFTPVEEQTIDRWGQPPSQPTYRLPPPRLEALSSPPAFPSVAQAASPVLGGAQVFASRAVQYQGWAYPFQIEAPVATTVEWLPGYPDRPLRAPSTAALASFYAEFDSVVPLGHVGWLPSYPDALQHRPVPASGSVEPPFSVRDLGHVGWQGWQPDQIARVVVRAADQQALFAVRYLPIADLRWLGSFPERTLRILPPPWQGTAVFYPFPYENPAAPDLSWQGEYPDRVWRLVLPTGAILMVGPQNLVPIPNEGGGNDQITLGVEIGVTPVPVLGGWVPF